MKDVAGTVATGELSDGTEVFGKVTLRTGGGIQSRAESVRVIGEPPLGQDFATGLPMTAAEAVAAGWKDPVCVGLAGDDTSRKEMWTRMNNYSLCTTARTGS